MFYNLQPEMSLCIKGKVREGVQKSKERVTVLFCCNAYGSEKLQLTVVTRCFKRGNRLSCTYQENNEAWMTAALFKQFFHSSTEGWQVRTGRCPDHRSVCCHLKQITLENVKAVFLPPNTTTHLQLLDAQNIQNVKHHSKSNYHAGKIDADFSQWPPRFNGPHSLRQPKPPCKIESQNSVLAVALALTRCNRKGLVPRYTTGSLDVLVVQLGGT